MKSTPRLLHGFLVAITTSSALAYASAWAEIHVRHKHEFPYDRTLLPPSYRFADLLCFQDRFPYFHTARFFAHFLQTFNSLPTVALLYRFFYSFGFHAHAPFFWSPFRASSLRRCCLPGP